MNNIGFLGEGRGGCSLCILMMTCSRRTGTQTRGEGEGKGQPHQSKLAIERETETDCSLQEIPTDRLHYWGLFLIQHFTIARLWEPR